MSEFPQVVELFAEALEGGQLNPDVVKRGSQFGVTTELGPDSSPLDIAQEAERRYWQERQAAWVASGAQGSITLANQEVASLVVGALVGTATGEIIDDDERFLPLFEQSLTGGQLSLVALASGIRSGAASVRTAAPNVLIGWSHQGYSDWYPGDARTPAGRYGNAIGALIGLVTRGNLTGGVE